MVMLLLLTAGLVTLLLAVSYSTRDYQQQWRLQQTADNGARSMAVVLARNLNFLALTNRALLANQVAIAQLTGIASWLAMFDDGMQRLAMISRVIPYVNAITHKLAVIVTKSRHVFDRGIQAALLALNALIKAISATQIAANLAFTTMAIKTLDEVILDHHQGLAWDAFHSPGIIPVPLLWWRRVQSVSTAQVDAGDEFASLAQASRDGFSKSRSYDWFSLGVLKVTKAGGTELTVNRLGQWNWQSIDTTSIHQRLLWFSSELAWARGARQQVGNANYDVSNNRFGQSSAANPRGTYGAVQRGQSFGQAATGFRFFELIDDTTAIPRVVVKVTEQPTKRFAVARAGVSFARPLTIFPRADGAIELANLFNPLWVSQSESLSLSDRLLLRAGSPQ